MANRRHGKKKARPFRRSRKKVVPRPEELIEIRELALLRVAPKVPRRAEPEPPPPPAPLQAPPTHVTPAGQVVRLELHCWFCGCLTTPPVGPREQHPPTMRTRDHLLPRSRGGTGEAHNIVQACAACNQRKGNNTLGEYRQTMIACGRPAEFWAETLRPIEPEEVVYFAALHTAWGWAPRLNNEPGE